MIQNRATFSPFQRRQLPHVSIAMLRNFIFSRGALVADGTGPVVAATTLLLDPFCTTPDPKTIESDFLFPEEFGTAHLQMRLLPHVLDFLRFCGATRRR